MYKAISKNYVISSNTNIEADGFSQLLLKNIGECNATINDNIPLSAGDTFSWENRPGTEISETTFVRFIDANPNKKVLVIKIYFVK